MNNAHLRVGSVIFKRFSEKINASTNVKTFCDRYICDENQLHLISFFGGDTEMAAFSAAIQDGRQLGVEFAGHSLFYRSLGANARCYKSPIPIRIADRDRKLVHIVAASETLEMQLTGTQDCVYCLNDSPMSIWDTLVYVFGLPAAPDWADWIYDRLDDGGMIEALQSAGVKAVRVNTTRLDLMKMIRKGLRKRKLLFPPTNGPLLFKARTVVDLLAIDEPFESMAA